MPNLMRLIPVIVPALLATGLGAQEPAVMRPLAWRGYDPTAPLDRGLGVVAFRRAPVEPGVADSLRILAAPRAGAPVRAWFVQQFRGDSFPYGVAALAGASANLVEFEYEAVGMPIDSVGAGTDWARVVYGFDANRRPLLGWVSRDSSLTRSIMWADFLPQRNLYLLDSVHWAFADGPGGEPVGVPTPSSPGDYALYPMRVSGSWLQVRIVVPSDTCEDPEPEPRTAIGWLRYLDPRGRPLVWFYPRGC
ncbi:MAG: hypothetical protein AB7Q69_16180 [Gemmatimonadales bacterium]